MDRIAIMGQLDVAYLARSLSADPIPAIAERLPTLPEAMRSAIRRAVLERYGEGNAGRQRAWFEWNLASGRARQALDASFNSP